MSGMNLIGVGLVLSLILTVAVGDAHDVIGYREKRNANGITPGELKAKTKTLLICHYKKQLEVKYDGKPVVCDELMTEAETERKPTTVYFDAVEDKLYTLLMIDPEGGNHYGPGRYWLHWAVKHIPGHDLWKGTVADWTGEDLIAYAGPTPPSRTGDHHYQFFLLREKSGAAIKLTLTRENIRADFSLEDFVEHNEFLSIDAVFQYRVHG